MSASVELRWKRWAMLYLRIALGAAFLSGIADRFGLYRGRNVGYGNFDGFLRYTAQVNSFMPASTIPFLGWAATCAAYISMGRSRTLPGQPDLSAIEWSVATLGVLVAVAMMLMKVVPAIPGHFSAYEWLALGIWIALGAITRRRAAPH